MKTCPNCGELIGDSVAYAVGTTRQIILKAIGSVAALPIFKFYEKGETMPRKADTTIIDKVYNNLKVDKLTDQYNSYHRRLYECTCLLCGKKRLATKQNLQRNEVKDCGNHRDYNGATFLFLIGGGCSFWLVATAFFVLLSFDIVIITHLFTNCNR